MKSVRPTERLFHGLCLGAVVLPLVVLVVLVGDVVIDGAGRLSWDFLTGYPSRKADHAGILPALAGSLCLLGLTAVIALPVGVAAAVYLEEYGRKSLLGRIIEVNVANLAGVPSILYGVLGLGIFVRLLGLGHSLITGALTMSLLVLPIVIVSTREALRTVPQHLREACLALGGTRLMAIRVVVLPMALPGILTGAILALSRAIGETAPLVVIGALTFVTFLPDGLDSPFTALPIQIFNWVSRPQAAFVQNAAAGIVVLLVTLVLMNGVVVVLRGRVQRKVQW